MYSRVELITPEKARAYLERNIANNRNVSSKVDEYARDMKNGKWQLTSQGITFNRSGLLTDGQHRLKAVIKANVPVEMYVTYGEPDDTYIHDRGRQRSVPDVIVIGGGGGKASTTDLSKMSACAKLLFNACGESRPSIACLAEFVNENFDPLFTSCKLSRANSRSGIMWTGAGVAACFCAMYCGISEKVLRSFFGVANSGFQNGPEDSAAIVARNFTQGGWKKEIANFGTTAARKRALSVYCFAVRDFAEGNTRTRVYRATPLGETPFIQTVMERLMPTYGANKNN